MMDHSLALIMVKELQKACQELETDQAIQDSLHLETPSNVPKFFTMVA